MGRNNRQRRAAKQKIRARRGPTPPRPGHPGHDQAERDLADDAARFLSEFDDLLGASEDSTTPPPRRSTTQATVGQRARGVLEQALGWVTAGVSADDLASRVAEELGKHPDEVLDRLDRLVSAELLQAAGGLWEHGWQPRELIHVATRIDKWAAVLAADLAVEQLTRTGRLEQAPPGWRSQLDDAVELARSSGVGRWSPPGDWVAVDRLVQATPSSLAAWTSAFRLLGRVWTLPVLAMLAPPPSTWASTPTPPRASRATASTPASAAQPAPDRDKVLTTIRALLAKAESTEFAAEAEVFTAKAQALMTRHAIDEALLHAAADETVEVVSRRVLIDNPYLVEKVHLLSAVGVANRTKVVWMEELAMATIVGTPVDADQVEMLFVSLLIQATRAMAEAGAARTGTFDRSPRFRRAFLTSYAVRIGERLSEADAEATASYGSELVPVLRRQEEAVDAAYEQLFPHTRAMASRKTYDRRGWHAGREAADRATFVAGRIAG